MLSLASAAALCLGLAACGGTKTPSPDTSSNGDAVGETMITLTESWQFSSGFYPVLTASNSSNYGATFWNRNFYNTLVCYGENGEIKGELAEKWDVSDDGLTYTFTLRDGVKFSDGTDLTAGAVKTSFETAIKSLGQYNGSYGKLTSVIASMEAADDNTFVLTLSQPYYGTLNDLTMCSPLAIVNPAGISEDLLPKDDFLSQTMGTGPYMYEGETDGTSYTFVSNPYYWGEAPEVGGFKIKVIEDNDAKVLALRSGEIDAILGTSRLSYDAYGEISGEDAFARAVDNSGTMTRCIGMNLSKPPFDDANVRRAMAYALDQGAICDAVFQGVELPAETMFEKSKMYCDVAQTTYEFDLDKANALMDEAGWIDSDGDGIREKDGQKLEFTIIYTQSIGSLDNAVLAIASQLSKIGFKITPNGTDMMTWFGTIGSGEYTLALYQTYGGAYDPTTVMTNMNADGSSDPVARQISTLLEGGNALILELNSTEDEKRVQEIYAEILGTVADQAIMIPISYTREFAVWNKSKMAGYDFYPDGQYVCVSGIHVK